MKKFLIVIVAAAVTLAGCAGMSNQGKGTAIGAATGALVGGLVSNNVGAVLLGAAIGGAAGNLIGKEMDKQARELKQAVPTAEVQRIGEGINLTFDSKLMFPINSAVLSDSYKDDLAAAAEVLKKYPDTNILVEGHTDDTGSDAINNPLSQKRAQAVSSFLASQGVAPGRLETKWFGSSQPKFPNDSEANRAKNRRVELAIYANDEMVADAKAGAL
jgi:outer membrane protein OmpA-like peptidoglycan-associated protein